MSLYTQLLETLWQQMSPLPDRAKGLVFLLSAFRHLPLYQYSHEIKQVGDPVRLQHILEEVFHHCSHGLSVTDEVHQRWCDTLLELHPEEYTGGVLGTIAGNVTIVTEIAGSALYHSFKGAFSMDYCLASLSFKIGQERLGIGNPGDSTEQMFYEVVMNDARFIQEQRHLENDIATLLQNGDTDFSNLAVKLRCQAEEQAWNATEFCQPLLELEVIWTRERIERRQRMKEQPPKSVVPAQLPWWMVSDPNEWELADWEKAFQPSLKKATEEASDEATDKSS